MAAIGMSRGEAWDALERERLRDENKLLREALAFYAKPRTYGTGEHAVFLDDCGVARAAFRELEPAPARSSPHPEDPE